MRIFILHNKIKAGSYADALFRLLIQLLTERGFILKDYHDINETREANIVSEKAAIILHTGKKKLSFFSKLKVQAIIKKGKFANFIQVTDSKLISSRVSQFVLSNNNTNFIARQGFSAHFFAVCSKAEKEKMEELNVANAEIMRVVSISADDKYQPITWSGQQAVKMQYTQGREYFLTLAGNQTIQSFTELLKAFSTFKKWQHSSMKLVVMGKLFFTETEEWKEKISTYKFREDVVMLNNLVDNEAIQTLAGAYAFIHMPHGDNDIIPLLQSIKCDIPCLSFATDSIEEYAGEAAIIVEQNNYNQLAEKMILIYKDEALRSRLIAKGQEQSSYYTKEKTLAALSDVLLLPLR